MEPSLNANNNVGDVSSGSFLTNVLPLMEQQALALNVAFSSGLD